MAENVNSTLIGMEAVELDDAPPVALAGAPVPPPKLKAVSRPRASGEPAFMPEPPKTLQASGLNASYIEELCLKHLFQAGDLRGSEIAARTCLPAMIIEE